MTKAYLLSLLANYKIINIAQFKWEDSKVKCSNRCRVCIVTSGFATYDVTLALMRLLDMLIRFLFHLV